MRWTWSGRRWTVGWPATEGYGNSNSMMDGTPVLCISAWDVVFSTGDKTRLNRWLPALERLVAGWKSRDVDNNGLYESPLSGNRGDWRGRATPGTASTSATRTPTRCRWVIAGFAAWPTSNVWPAGPSRPKLYDHDADRILAAYVPTFLNPKTGILAGWKSRDGELHDYWFTMINGMAISYGLVPDELANKIMDRMMAKMREVGYTRFDLGLPWQLVPIPKNDYLPGPRLVSGGSVKEDGSDGFQNFVNGARSGPVVFLHPSPLQAGPAGGGRQDSLGRIGQPMPPTVSRTASAQQAAR